MEMNIVFAIFDEAFIALGGVEIRRNLKNNTKLPLLLD